MKKLFLSILILLFTQTLFAENEKSILFKIIKKKSLTVSVGANYEPYYIENSLPDYPGFEVEIAQAYADFLGVTLNKVVPLQNFSEHASAIQSGKIDLALGNSSSIGRMKYVYFSEPYISVSVGGLVNKNIVPSETDGDIILNRTYRSLTDIANLNRLSFGVKEKTSNYDYIKKTYGQYPIQVYTDDVQALKALKENKVNCYIADNLFLEGLLQKDNSLRARYIPLLQPVIEKQLSFAFKKYDTQILINLNLFIRELKRTGEINRLKNKYFNSNKWVPKDNG